jgi:rod shape determining protein RodA
LAELSLGSLAGSRHRRLFAHFPWHAALVVLAIGGLGILNLASASRSAHAPVWISQGWWMGVGILVAVLICFLDYRVFMRGAYLFYAIALILLVIAIFKGRTVMGARRWITLGPINLQPSEFMKIGVALALARFFHFDTETRREGYGLLQLLIPLGIILLPAVIVLKQPDLGTALIIVATGGTMTILAKVRWRSVIVILSLAVAGAVAMWPHLKPYQRKRVETFLNPEGDVLGAGYHATQSMIAVGSGRATGKGWGEGTQTMLSFLPEQHTDFIFSVWAEEQGFLGCLFLLALYFLLVMFSIGIAGQARDRFGHFLAAGITGMIFWQAFINMGMVTGVLPVVGVTLPLMSYGGSSVLTVFIGMGLLMNVGMRRFAI